MCINEENPTVNPPRGIKPAHVLETMIGLILVTGIDPNTDNGKLQIEALNKLSYDDAVWLKLWDAGITHVTLHV